MKSIAFAAAVVATACGHPVAAPATAPGPAAPPRLVVLVVIDQFPEWSFAAKASHFTAGFARLMTEGEWRVGEHPSAATLTAPGHTLFGTGAVPAQSGILANEWFRRGLERPLKSIEAADGSMTTEWLKVPGLGDALAAAGRGGKAIAISLKDRAAILPLGHTGTPIWYDTKKVAFTSMQRVPWLDAWNAAHPISAHLHDVWTIGLPNPAAVTGLPDDAPGEIGEKGFTTTFPHRIADTPNPADAIYATPVGNQVVLELAADAVAAAGLGADDVPDLLVVSLSAHDYVGHGWGHESWEMWDLDLKLDQQLATFMDVLDARVGHDAWAMIVTSDHGASPMPDANHGGRIVFDDLRAAADAAAATVLGPGHWVADARYPTIFLTAAARTQPADRRAAAIAAIASAVGKLPGIALAEPTEQLAGHCETRTGRDHVICLALDPERSGEVVYIPAEHWVFEDAGEHVATAHGSIYDYDREVTLLVLPPGHHAHARQTSPAAGVTPMQRIAPTLAHWLGIAPPAAATAQPL